MEIITDTFRISSSEYMRGVMGRWLIDRWWIVVLPVGLCLCAAAVYGVLWVAVAAVLVCMILPFAMMMVYMNYALSREAVCCIRRHRVRISRQGGLEVLFEADAESGREFRSEVYDLGDIMAVEDTGEALWISFRGRRYGYLVVPFSAVADGGGATLTELMERIAEANECGSDFSEAFEGTLSGGDGV